MSSDTYGRRKDDAMPSELTPEMIASLTDSQKINLRIIQNLTSLNTAINDVKHDVGNIRDEVSVHDKILVTGNGVPSLQERLRNLEKFMDSFQFWSRSIGLAIVLQTLAFFIGIIIAIVRFLPLLEQLASKP